jgi:stearoyl-CoA desaturase (delta-9 desaturase)
MFSLSAARGERVFHTLFAHLVQGLVPSPRAYAILHREHHAYSDEPGDPHAPRFFANVLTMMWATRDGTGARPPCLDARASVPRGVSGLGEPRHAFADRWPVRIGWGAVYLLLYVWLATAWWQFLLLPVHWVMGPIHGAIVNWCGHRYGYRNYMTRDASRNVIPLDFLMLGELFQNNHHRAPGRLNFAARRFEFDPTFAVLRLLARTGALRLRPTALELS